MNALKLIELCTQIVTDWQAAKTNPRGSGRCSYLADGSGARNPVAMSLDSEQLEAMAAALATPDTAIDPTSLSDADLTTAIRYRCERMGSDRDFTKRSIELALKDRDNVTCWKHPGEPAQAAVKNFSW